jgi:carbamoylphosphate synthase large subunit
MEEHIATLPGGFRQLTSPQDLIATISDNNKLHDFLAHSGFQEYLPAVFREGEEVRYPCVVKRLDLYAGDGVRIAHDTKELVSHLRDPLFRQHPYQIQELIAGELEYVTHLVCKSGEILEEYSFEYRMRGPAEIRRFRSPIDFKRSQQRDEVMLVFSRIVKSLNFTGPCNVNFKLVDGRPLVFEINPRLGGSLMKRESIDGLAKVVGAILNHAD